MAGYTTGQAGASLQPTTVPTAYSGDAQELARSQRLAQMLMSNEVPQGQMVSGRFVAPSWTQNLAQLVNTGTGAYFADKAEKQQLDLARKIREGEAGALQGYIDLVQGKPAMGDQPAVVGDPRIANMRIVQDERAPSWLRQHAITQITKPPQYKEISLVNKETGNTDIYRYDINSPDPKSTMQFMGTGKPALSRADEIRFADEGIPTGLPKSNAPAGSVSAPAGGVVPPAVNTGNQVVTPVNAPAKPAAKDDPLVKAFGYDPFKPPAPPANIKSGKDLRAYQADQSKPLTGTAADQVTGAKLYSDALTKYNDYVNSLTASDLTSPSVRIKLTSLHSQAKLAGKEANKLGVLNGGDERILDEVLPNYKDITVTKGNLKNLIQNQKEFGTSIIVNAYGTQQKAVPENMRKYVVVPQTVTETKTDTPAQRYVLNGEPIEVRNGVWVYSKTGKVAK